MAVKFWTNPSVLRLSGAEKPIDAIEEAARSVIFRFLENGGKGPPFNPIELAEFLGIETVPSNDVRDARTTFSGGRFVVEFNPNRPKSRINYSICHEITHTFFPDCKEKVRNRSLHSEMGGDEWQLEMLCNIGASELLIPAEHIPQLGQSGLTIEHLLELRGKFDVSMEALLLRLARATSKGLWVFAASRIEPEKSLYKVDYAIASGPQLPGISSGLVLPKNSVVGDCTAIGFTSRGSETWGNTLGTLKVECVGIPAFPGHPFPRVVGFVVPTSGAKVDVRQPSVVRGDATKPRGAGQKIVCFVVNDATPRWGAGFALAVRRKFPTIQESFIGQVNDHPENLRLGETSFLSFDSQLSFAPMVCQHGYGQSPRPRIRYSALEACLKTVAEAALREKATVHMPRIGSGQAGGNWSVIFDLVEQNLSRLGIDVTVYDLPGGTPAAHEQQSLLFSR